MFLVSVSRNRDGKLEDLGSLFLSEVVGYDPRNIRKIPENYNYICIIMHKYNAKMPKNT